MPEPAFIARLFLIGGGVLAVTGLILWLALPLKLSFPPFLITALLSMAYGIFCLERGRPRSPSLKKRNVAKRGKK